MLLISNLAATVMMKFWHHKDKIMEGVGEIELEKIS